jgi:hypothetical protein
VVVEGQGAEDPLPERSIGIDHDPSHEPVPPPKIATPEKPAGRIAKDQADEDGSRYPARFEASAPRDEARGDERRQGKRPEEKPRRRFEPSARESPELDDSAERWGWISLAHPGFVEV